MFIDMNSEFISQRVWGQKRDSCSTPGNAATTIWTALKKWLCPPLTVVVDIGTEVDTLCLPKRICEIPFNVFQKVRLCKVGADQQMACLVIFRFNCFIWLVLKCCLSEDRNRRTSICILLNYKSWEVLNFCCSSRLMN